MSIFLAIVDVPELPGATKSFLHKLLCVIFQAKVCSLPPEPKTNIFIGYILIAKKVPFSHLLCDKHQGTTRFLRENIYVNVSISINNNDSKIVRKYH